jgi:hypothetical protein
MLAHKEHSKEKTEPKIIRSSSLVLPDPYLETNSPTHHHIRPDQQHKEIVISSSAMCTLHMEETMHKFLSVIKHFQTPSISKGHFEETAIGLATWFPLKTHIRRETLNIPPFL